MENQGIPLTMAATALKSKMAKWIDFQEVPTKTKTKIFVVINKDSGFKIGQVKWYSPFRKYSFFPEMNTVFEKTCLTDIAEFLKLLMEERQREKQ